MWIVFVRIAWSWYSLLRVLTQRVALVGLRSRLFFFRAGDRGGQFRGSVLRSAWHSDPKVPAGRSGHVPATSPLQARIVKRRVFSFELTSLIPSRMRHLGRHSWRHRLIHVRIRVPEPRKDSAVADRNEDIVGLGHDGRKRNRKSGGSLHSSRGNCPRWRNLRDGSCHIRRQSALADAGIKIHS